MKVAVIILNFNGRSLTTVCVDSVLKSHHADFEIEPIVVDNASSDGSVEEISKKFPKVTLIRNEENLGFSEGNNIGIRAALVNDADFVLILNNDTTIDPSCIATLLTVAQKETKAAIFGPKIYFSPGSEYHHDRYKDTERGRVIWYAGGKVDWDNVLASHRGVDEVDLGQYEVPIKTAFVTGCAMFVRREVFKTVGFLDPKLYLYYEDLDFCKRAQAKGFDIMYVPAGRVWHKNAQSSGGSGSDLQSYYITRNRLLMGMRYAPWRAKLALFREATRLLINGTPTQREAVGDFLRKKYGRREGNVSSTPKTPNLLSYFKKGKNQPKKN